MNKSELVLSASKKIGATQKNVNEVLDAILETITEVVCSGEKVTLVGFGIFEKRERKARTSRNPKTNEKVEVPAHYVPVFKAGKNFQEKINE